MAVGSWESQWHRTNGSTLAAQGRISPTSALLPSFPNLSSSYTAEAFSAVFRVNVTTGPPTHSAAPARVRDATLAHAEIAVLGLILALTALGNGFVLWVLLRRRKHRAPMHLFMVNLCVADLVVAFFQVLPQLVWDITERFQGPDVLCRSVKYLQIVGMFASSYMIVAMTIDRHYAICCPLQAYRDGATSCWNTPVMVAWGLALLFSLPQVFIFSMSEVSAGVFECWGHFVEPWGLKAYVTWMTLAVFVAPALIIIVCQVRIFREIHKNVYLKSDRGMSAEYKKSPVLLHFQKLRDNQRQMQRERTRRGGGGGQSKSPQPGNGKPSGSHGKTSSLSDHLPGDSSNYSSPLWSQMDQSASSPDPLLSHLLLAALNLNHTQTTQGLSPHPGSSEALRATPSHMGCDLLCNAVVEMSTSSDPEDPPKCDTASYTAPLGGPPARPPLALPPPGVSKAVSKTVRMTLVIVLVYTLCWSPFFIVQLWAAWDPNPPDQGVAFTILMLLASLNSCTNPWIYTAFSSSVSRELAALVRCRPHTSRRTSLPDDSTATHTSTTAAKESLC
ncbi:vasopressin V2 receptor-like [Arapaima gigas]